MPPPSEEYNVGSMAEDEGLARRVEGQRRRGDLPTTRIASSNIRFLTEKIPGEILLFMADDRASGVCRMGGETRYAHKIKSCRKQILVLVNARQLIDKHSLRGILKEDPGEVFRIWISNIVTRDVHLYAKKNWQLEMAKNGEVPVWDTQGQGLVPVDIPNNCWVEKIDGKFMVYNYRKKPPSARAPSQTAREETKKMSEQFQSVDGQILFIPPQTRKKIREGGNAGKIRLWLKGHEKRPITYVPVVVSGEILACDGYPGVFKFRRTDIIDANPEIPAGKNQKSRPSIEQVREIPQNLRLYVSPKTLETINSGSSLIIMGAIEPRRGDCQIDVDPEKAEKITKADPGFDPQRTIYRFCCSAIIEQPTDSSSIQEVTEKLGEPPAQLASLHSLSGDGSSGDGEWNKMVARLLEIVSNNANTQRPLKITIREISDGVVREMIMEPTT